MAVTECTQAFTSDRVTDRGLSVEAILLESNMMDCPFKAHRSVESSGKLIDECTLAGLLTASASVDCGRGKAICSSREMSTHAMDFLRSKLLPSEQVRREKASPSAFLEITTGAKHTECRRARRSVRPFEVSGIKTSLLLYSWAMVSRFGL